jgi:hypothetical protein
MVSPTWIEGRVPTMMTGFRTPAQVSAATVNALSSF